MPDDLVMQLHRFCPFLGIDYAKVQDSIREIFQRKGDAIVELNLKALAAGKEIAEKLM